MDYVDLPILRNNNFINLEIILDPSKAPVLVSYFRTLLYRFYLFIWSITALNYWIKAFRNCLTINKNEIQFRYHPTGKVDYHSFNIANNNHSTVEKIKIVSYSFTVDKFRGFTYQEGIRTKNMKLSDSKKFSVLYLCNQCNYYHYVNIGSNRNIRQLTKLLTCG